MKLPCYNSSGQKQADCQVADAVFGIKEINYNLIKGAYEYYLAKKRVNLAKTKSRGQVSGGGRKPWRQKGLGRARVGSIRSPIWRGGGVVFGPTGQENYQKKINKKVKQLALRYALSLNRQQILIIESLPADSKTASLAKLLFKTLKLDKKVLLVDVQPEDGIALAARNLQNVALMPVAYLNVFRVINSDWLVLTNDALQQLENPSDSLKGFSYQKIISTQMTDLLIPHLTEKTQALAEKLNVFVFKADPCLNKNQIKASLEAEYAVEVVKLRTQVQTGKKSSQYPPEVSFIFKDWSTQDLEESLCAT